MTVIVIKKRRDSYFYNYHSPLKFNIATTYNLSDKKLYSILSSREKTTLNINKKINTICSRLGFPHLSQYIANKYIKITSYTGVKLHIPATCPERSLAFICVIIDSEKHGAVETDPDIQILFRTIVINMAIQGNINVAMYRKYYNRYRKVFQKIGVEVNRRSQKVIELDKQIRKMTRKYS